MSTVIDRLGPEPVESKRHRRRLGALSILGPVTVLGLLFGYPLVTVVQQSFEDRLGRPQGNLAWRTVLASKEFRTGLTTTVELAVGSTLGCVVLGTFFAVVLAFVPFPGGRVISRMSTVVLAFPSFVIALSFAVLYSRTGVVSAALDGLTGTHELLGGFIYTPWAVALAEITFYTPFVVRPVLAACKQVQLEQLHVAASLGAGPGRVVRQVLLPELVPSIVAGGSLCLLLTLNEFGIVLFIGAKDVLTLPVLIYTKGIVSFDYPAAAVLSCIQVVLSVALYGVGRLLLARLGGHRAAVD